MANPEHLAKLKEGVKAWNEFLVAAQQNFLRPGSEISRAQISGLG